MTQQHFFEALPPAHWSGLVIFGAFRGGSCPDDGAVVGHKKAGADEGVGHIGRRALPQRGEPLALHDLGQRVQQPSPVFARL